MVPESTDKEKEVVPYSSTKNGPTNSTTIRPIQASFGRQMDFRPGTPKESELTDRIAFMVAKDKLPISFVEGEGFRSLMKFIVRSYTVPCRQTIANRLKGRYKALEAKAQNRLKNASNFGITGDIWTDLNQRSYLGLTVHFVEDFILRSMPLSLIPMKGSHTAENIGTELTRVLEEWQVPLSKVVSVTTDGAENMKKGIRDFFGADCHWICLAHTLDLVARKAVQEKDVSDVLEKVKGIVTFFKRSVAASESLNKAQGVKPLQLLQSCITRWNSTYKQLDRFKELSPIVKAILPDHKKAPAMVNSEESTIIEEVVGVLQPFDMATKDMSYQKTVTASKVIPILRLLRDNLKTAPVGESTTVWIEAHDEIVRRFLTVEGNVMLAIATLLDPRFKRDFFEDVSALKFAEHALKTELTDMCEALKEPVRAPADPEPGISANKGLWENRHKFKGPCGLSSAIKISSATMEYDAFIQLPTIDLHCDPLEYWKNETRFPNLRNLALKYVCILETSTPSERIFFSCG